MEVLGYRTTIALRLAAVLVCVTYVAIAGVAALAAGPDWVARANATCTRWNDRAPAAAYDRSATLADVYRTLKRTEPVERAELEALTALDSTPSAGASRALRLARANLRELRVATSAYSAGDRAGFVRGIAAWQADRRANLAFARLGATACA